MAFFYSRIVNIFQRKHRSAAPDDYRQYVLERLFPSIRYGRDIDLERYIMMRENKKNSMEWGSAYQSLAFRYTEGERKRLIRSFRKKQGIFEKVFAQIMDELFRRVVQNLKNRIDILLQEFKVINQASRSSRDAMLLSGIERIVGLCSPEKDGAAEGAEFYLDFARHLGYRQNELVPVVTLVQGYADGSLFEEAAVKEAYRFDIREEYRKHHRLKPQRKQAFTLQLLITEEDIASIVVATEDMNEYEQTYEYFSRYLPLAGNREFATKIYAYSKKHQTSHFRIFEAVRKGMEYGHQKGRTFDDVFKIICEGRYVFNIRSERTVSEKLKMLGVPGKQKRRIPVVMHGKPEKRLALPEKKLPEKKEPEKKKIEEKPVRQVKAVKQKTDEKPRLLLVKDQVAPSKARPVGAKPQPEEKPLWSNKAVPVSAQNELSSSVKKMLGEAATDRRMHRMLIREFRRRLPTILTEAVRVSPVLYMDETRGAQNVRELIYYVLHNYEQILQSVVERPVHKERLEKLGFSLHTITTAIMTCVNEVKMLGLSGELK